MYQYHEKKSCLDAFQTTTQSAEKCPAVKSLPKISSRLDLAGSEKKFISIRDFVP